MFLKLNIIFTINIVTLTIVPHVIYFYSSLIQIFSSKTYLEGQTDVVKHNYQEDLCSG